MGGAAGHMAHPFDLSWVSTGSDLLDFFDRARTFVEKKGAASVKIDGVNVSFKVVGDDETKQFAVDRGSLKPIDIQGITTDRVDQRFPEGHGMRPAIKTLLAILNAAIGDIKPELEALGMWDDPSRFLNTEYVAGQTNVTQYDENFLAIHGLNQFYHKVHSRTGQERPGLSRPEGEKAASVEVPYEPAVMAKLVGRLTPYAEERGFQVYSSVPTEKLADIDFSGVLSEPLSIRISDDREITKTLGEWLAEATNPRYKTVKLKDGTRTHSLHKQLYLNILNQTTPIVDLIEDADAEAAIYGAVFMHATRMFGNEVLRGLTSPMGDVMNHEGVVLRDEKLFGPQPVKITGEFIVGNLGGGFGTVKEDEELEEELDLEIVDNEDADPVGSGAGTDTVALVPGAFKPPHRGHLEMVEHYASEADRVVVLISKPTKSSRKLPNGRIITAADSLQMWNALSGHLPNVEIQISDRASPIEATYEYIGENGPLKPGTEVILGVCSKGGDPKRYEQAGKYVKEGVLLRSLEDCVVAPAQHSPEYMGTLNNSPLKAELPSVTGGKNPAEFHASDMRYLLGKAAEDEEAVELLEDFVGGMAEAMEVLSILGIDTGINEPLEEISGMGVGSVEGGAGNSKTPLVGRSLSTAGKRDTKKKKKKQKEYIDLSLVDEVMELLIERGIVV